MGRKVSLLNDAGGPLPKSSTSQHRSSRSRGFARSNHKAANDKQSKTRTSYSASRKSSCSSRMSVCSQSSYSDNSRASNFASRASSPASCTTTPQLFRNSSTSSDQSQRSLHSPSPMTPTYSFDPLEQNKQNPANPNEPFYRPNGPYFATIQQAVQAAPTQPQQYYPMTSANSLVFDDYQMQQQQQQPPFPAPPNVPFAYPAELIQPTSPISLASPTSSVAPTSAASPTAASASGSTGGKPAKKKYPCPHAARYNCTDTFTTSGHAARHGKKHTGEKNILCPVCSKAFTRKDNMKQHERTHRSNRDSAPNAPGDPSKQTGTSAPPSAPMSTTGPADDSSSDQQATNSAAPRKKVRPSTTAWSDNGPSNSANTLLDTLDTQLRAYGGVINDDDDDDDMRFPDPDDPSMQRRALTHMPLHMRLDGLETGHAVDGSKKRKGKGKGKEATVPVRPNMGRTTSGDSAVTEDGEGESPGLDALAMAASGFAR